MIAVLCLRCLVVLAVVSSLALLVGGIVWGRQPGGSSLMGALAYLPFILLVAVVPTFLVGLPVGVLTAHLLAGQRREWVHIVTFALVGAVLSVVICALSGLFSVVGWFALVAAAEGAVGAGGARWWTGRVHTRRAGRSAAEGAAPSWGRIGP